MWVWSPLLSKSGIALLLEQYFWSSGNPAFSSRGTWEEINLYKWLKALTMEFNFILVNILWYEGVYKFNKIFSILPFKHTILWTLTRKTFNKKLFICASFVFIYQIKAYCILVMVPKYIYLRSDTLYFCKSNYRF